MATKRTLADFMPKKLEALAGQSIEVTGFTAFEGSLCKMALIRYKGADGIMHSVTTGGKFVLEALDAAEQANAFPLSAKFVKSGKAWTIEVGE